jgi:co-chaperonin GroES (HSP10)
MFRPLQDKVLVRLDNLLPETGPILLPADVSKWRDPKDQIGNRGVVVAVGPGLRNPKTQQHIQCGSQIGDVVRFCELVYTRHKDESGADYVLISDSEIVGVEEPGDWQEAA